MSTYERARKAGRSPLEMAIAEALDQFPDIDPWDDEAWVVGAMVDAMHGCTCRPCPQHDKQPETALERPRTRNHG